MNRKFLLIVFIIISCIIMPIIYATDISERIEVKYVKTSDGDTARFILDGENVRVRFLGINTPEVSGEDKVEEPYGNEALEYTANKLKNAKKIEIEYDNVADKEDRFGRKLAWIWVDDELYEIELLKQGLAKTYMLKDNYKYAKELKEAESIAKNNKEGIWSETKVENKINEKSNLIKENNINKELKTNEESIENDNASLESLVIIAVIIIIIMFLRSKNKTR